MSARRNFAASLAEGYYCRALGSEDWQETMKRLLKKISSGIWVGYSNGDYSTNLRGRNYEIEDACLTIDLSGNFRVKNKRANCYSEVCELAESAARLNKVQILDEQVIDGLGKAIQSGFDLKELKLIVDGRGTFKYYIGGLKKVSGSLFINIDYSVLN